MDIYPITEEESDAFRIELANESDQVPNAYTKYHVMIMMNRDVIMV